MLGLEDRVVVVTGGNKGIGAAAVDLLEDAGAKVAYTYRKKPSDRGRLAVQVDVTDPEDMRDCADRVEEELGPIYGVVCAAGAVRDGLVTKLSHTNWQEVVDVNLTGAWNTIQPIMPRLYKRKEGAIVLLSSVVGEQGNIGQANYAAAKGGLISLAKSLAREGARHDVRANAVAAGFVESDLKRRIPPQVVEKIRSRIPLRRFGRPEEVAWAIVYLLSPVASSFVTGEVVAVNGGQHM